jgi:hypothetical protein
MDESWTVGPPPERPLRRGGVFVVLALVAGFVGGLGAGYVIGDDPPRDEVEAVGAGLEPSGTDSASSATQEEVDSAVATTSAPAGPGFSSGPASRERLFRRVSAGGYSVRVFAREHSRPVESSCPPGQWCPPAECFARAGIEVDVVGEWTVTGGGGADFPLREGDTVRVLGMIFDWEGQDEPLFGVVARAAEGVQSVRLSGDGVTDEMTPIDGVVALVIPSSPIDPSAPMTAPAGARLEVVDAAGAARDVPLSIAGTPDPQCVPPPPPPPALPAPGEQPVDVAAQDAAVRERFAYVFGPDSDEKLDEAVDDPAGLDVLRTELKERHPAAIGNVEYQVGELVFTSPDVAAYQFRPVVSGRELPWQIGGARFIDGKWMITRATLCAMYSLGGSSC